MIPVLDTSVLIDIENNSEPSLARLKEIRKTYETPPRISFITYFEFFHGLRRRQFEKRKEAMELLDLFDILEMGKTTARKMSQLKDSYPSLSLSDVIIASQAIECGGILITRDRDFEQIKELEKVIF